MTTVRVAPSVTCADVVTIDSDPSGAPPCHGAPASPGLIGAVNLQEFVTLATLQHGARLTYVYGVIGPAEARKA